jgi:hypothetical protein
MLATPSPSEEAVRTARVLPFARHLDWLLPVALAAALAGASQLRGQTPARALTPEQWREDLRFLAQELPRRHRSPFDPVKGAVTPDSFARAVAALDRRIPELPDADIIVGLARIVCLLGDGHTRLTLPEDTAVAFSRAHTETPPPNVPGLYLHHLPVKFDLYQEGLFVRAATAERRDLIGARVLEIGRMPAESAVAAVRGVVEHDNEMGFRLLAPVQLGIPEVLHATGIADDPGRTRLVVSDAAHGTRELLLEPVPLFHAPAFIEARDLGPGARPLAERHLERWYWMEYLAPRRALYVQVNRIGSAPDESMLAFSRRIGRVLRDSGAVRLVLDLRHNPGGNGGIALPLLDAIVRSDVNRPGHLFVLIGRETFSAAQMLVNDLEQLSHAIFVGEASGSSPSAFGDSRRFRLPNSGLTIRASTIYWRDRDTDERRAATEPHIPVPVTASDYFAHRDRALEAALAFQAPDDPAAVVRAIHRTAGWEPTMRLCWRFTADPRLADEAAARGVAECGVMLLAEKRDDDAVEWFRATLDFLPASVPSLTGLGRALLAKGDTAAARAPLEQARRLAPTDTAAKRLLDGIGTGRLPRS